LAKAEARQRSTGGDAFHQSQITFPSSLCVSFFCVFFVFLAPFCGYYVLAIGYWLLAIGYWLLAIGYALRA
jgi:hypothetical protein